MASGDTLAVLVPTAARFPTSNAPTFDTRNNHLVLDFDDTADETCYFPGVMPRHYGGSGVTVTIVWMATDTTVTPHDCVWYVDWERHQADTTDLDSDGFTGAGNQVTDQEASVSGEPSYASITFTDGADMDSVAAGESFRLLVRREPTDAADDLTDDAELLRVEIKET
jgi:hypothetical protein